jgi:hypothetical protein
LSLKGVAIEDVPPISTAAAPPRIEAPAIELTLAP